MKNEIPSHNERQFNRLGMQELYTDEVKNKLQSGAQRIEHKFSANFDGVPVKGTVHLNKAKNNDYFINKFNVSKQHASNGQEINQTFFVNNRTSQRLEGVNEKVHQQWTLKRGYNFLSGRPVYDRMSNSWEQINLNEKLANGNYATHRFGPEYKVDLDKTMSHYQFAAQGNKHAMDRIKEGLERGNLQPVQFKNKEGGMETYKVALAPRTGALRVYDAKNREVPLEVQVERKMISNEFKNSLIELYGKRKLQADSSIDPKELIGQAVQQPPNQRTSVGQEITDKIDEAPLIQKGKQAVKQASDKLDGTQLSKKQSLKIRSPRNSGHKQR